MFRVLMAAAIIVILFVILFGSATVWPNLGAKGTAAMRVVLGDKITAKIEGAMLSAGDWFHRVEYSMGIGHNQDPLGISVSTTATPEASPTTMPSIAGSDGQTAAVSPPTTTQPAFRPASLTPMGTLVNEGRWQPYITDKYQWNASVKPGAFHSGWSPTVPCCSRTAVAVTPMP